MYTMEYSSAGLRNARKVMMLDLLRQFGPMSTTGVADALALPPNYVIRLLKNYLRQSLVQRMSEPTGERGRPPHIWAITPTGERRLAYLLRTNPNLQRVIPPTGQYAPIPPPWPMIYPYYGPFRR